jgi:hypothetical protein
MNIYISKDIYEMIEISQNHLNFYHPNMWFDCYPFDFSSKKVNQSEIIHKNFFTPKGIRAFITCESSDFEEYYWDNVIEKMEECIEHGHSLRYVPNHTFSPFQVQKNMWMSKFRRIFDAYHGQSQVEDEKTFYANFLSDKLRYIHSCFIPIVVKAMIKNQEQGPISLRLMISIVRLYKDYKEAPYYFMWIN